MICALVSSSAYAADEPESYSFNIPQVDASAKIDAISQTSNTSVVFSFDKVKNIRANPLNGQYSLEQALDVALFGTGLQAQLAESKV